MTKPPMNERQLRRLERREASQKVRKHRRDRREQFAKARNNTARIRKNYRIAIKNLNLRQRNDLRAAKSMEGYVAARAGQLGKNGGKKYAMLTAEQQKSALGTLYGADKFAQDPNGYFKKRQEISRGIFARDEKEQANAADEQAEHWEQLAARMELEGQSQTSQQVRAQMQAQVQGVRQMAQAARERAEAIRQETIQVSPEVMEKLEELNEMFPEQGAVEAADWLEQIGSEINPDGEPEDIDLEEGEQFDGTQYRENLMQRLEDFGKNESEIRAIAKGGIAKSVLAETDQLRAYYGKRHRFRIAGGIVDKLTRGFVPHAQLWLDDTAQTLGGKVKNAAIDSAEFIAEKAAGGAKKIAQKVAKKPRARAPGMSTP